MLRQIQLHGALADKFGKAPIELDVDTPDQLIRGLFCVIDGFEQEFRKNTHYKIFRFNRQKLNVQPVTTETWKMTLGKEPELHIVPVAEGAGIEIGAAVAAFFELTGYAALAVEIAVDIVVAVAVSAAVSSITSAMSPMPKTAGGNTPAAEKPSFIFNQVLNVTTPGNPVPLVYGECLTGSVVISVGVATEQLL